MIESNAIRVLKGTCVEQYLYRSTMIRKEMPYSHQRNKTSSSETLESCKEGLRLVLLYHIYLPVQMDYGVTIPTWRIASNGTCPFENTSYQVVYTPSTGSDNHCHGDKSSVLTVLGDTIKILACDHSNHPELPLTGTLGCRALVSPTEFGEPDALGEGIVILEWISEKRSEPQYFCSRYRMDFNSDHAIDLSLDVTTSRSVQCQKGAKADWFGKHGGRNYIAMKLRHDPKLLLGESPDMAPSDEHSMEHLQFNIDMSLSELPAKDQLRDILVSRLAATCMIKPDRFINIDLENGENRNTEVTFTLRPGRPIIQTCADILWYKLSNNLDINAHANGRLIRLVDGSVHHWRDDVLCPKGSCQRGVRCRLWKGRYGCQCPQSSKTDAQCPNTDNSVSKISEGNKQTTIIISLSVCAVILVGTISSVVVIMTRRKREKENASEAGYDESGDMERSDRQLYSTIGQKPAAYHEKVFLDKDDEGHGEKTGIHVNGSYI